MCIRDSKNIKRKMSDLQKMTIEEQKKAVRSGYDTDRRVSTGTEGKKGRPSFPSSFSLDRLPLFAVYCSSFVRDVYKRQVLEKHGFTASDTFRPGMGYYEKQQI